MPSDDLRSRMEALNGRPLRNRPAPRAEPAKELDVPPPEPAPLCTALPGAECASPDGSSFYCIERRLEDEAPWAGSLAHRVRAALVSDALCARLKHPSGVAAEHVLFLDIETLGLQLEPIFLVGTLRVDGASMVCRQALARTLAEEGAILSDLAAALRHARALVTFNGIDFDLRLGQARARENGLALPTPRSHVDVLIEARRRFARKLPNCRLQTLEERVCGRVRTGDVPGARIPCVYKEFVATGDASMLAVVVRHNLIDLATTADLFGRFFAG